MANAQELTAEHLQQTLAERGRTLPLELFPLIDSTNSEAKRRIAAGDQTKQLLLAVEQTGGRGRMGRSFYSPAGTGLYMTLTLGKPDALQDPAMLTIATAAAVAGAIEAQTGQRTAIKWVNDIYMAGKKVCGILCEAVTDASGTTCVLAGIGVNIETQDFPEEIRDKAGALPKALDRAALAAEITDRLLSIWEAPADRTFLEFYRSRSFVPGNRVSFQREGKEQEALAVAVDDSGALRIRYDDGREEALRSGEVSVRIRDRRI